MKRIVADDMDYQQLNPRVAPVEVAWLDVVSLPEQMNKTFVMRCAAITGKYIVSYTHQRGEPEAMCIHKTWMTVYIRDFAPGSTLTLLLSVIMLLFQRDVDQVDIPQNFTRVNHTDTSIVSKSDKKEMASALGCW